jgi:endonuclease/exonuclease/phosphatase family metal-dependent hydrolase
MKRHAALLLFFLLLVCRTNAMSPDVPSALRVMTLNIAHGRKDGFHQTFQCTSNILTHLDEIAEVIRRENPDIVALQEADGPCWWSGRFDHVKYIADKAGMPYSYRGEHVKLLMLSYGTAILSKLPLLENESIQFPSTWPSPPKGFVVSELKWNEQEIDIVSLHLDFLRQSVQQKQVGLLVDKLSKRKRPLIVMGDFNCDWDGTDSPLRILSQQLKLKAFRPKEVAGMESYGNTDRLDWILVSDDMAFDAYTTVPDVVSDHLAVLSELKFTNGAASDAPK